MTPSLPESPELSGSKGRANEARLSLSFLPSGGLHHRHGFFLSAAKIGVRPRPLTSAELFKMLSFVIKNYFPGLDQGTKLDSSSESIRCLSPIALERWIFIKDVH
jgi:hypothetical protein